MSVDPTSIPQHVVDAFHAGASGAWDHGDPYQAGIAAALDALMDDEPVMIPPSDEDPMGCAVRPSDVLTAVLNRSKT